MSDYTLSARITGDSSELQRAFQTAQASLENFGKKTSLLGAGMTASITLPFAKAVGSAVDFDTAMRKAATIAGATGDDFDKMSECALKLGATTSLSSSEVAAAMSEMAAKGYDVNQVIAAMPGVIAAAEASGEDLSLTADTVASAINGFGLAAGDSGHVADVLAMSANKTAAGVSDLGYAFKYSAPMANSLGISMEELAAATGIMADAGLDGSKAGTTLRMAFSQLVKPTDAAAAVMADMGFSAIDAEGNFKPLNQIVGELNGSMEGMTAAQKQATLSTIFGTEAASGMNVLLSKGSDELGRLTEELKNSDGASKEAADAMKAGIGGALDNLSGAAESAKISLMNQLVPTIKALTETITGLIDKFNSMPDGTKRLIAFAILGAAALGPLLTIIGVMTIGLSGLVGALGFLASPIGIVIAVVAALVAGIVTLYNTNAEFRTMVSSAWKDVQNVISGVVKTVMPIMQGLFDNAVSIFRGIPAALTLAFEAVTPIIQGVFSGILPVLQSVFSTIKSVVGIVGEAFQGFFQGLSQGFTSNLGGVLGFTQGLIAAFGGINPIVGLALQLIKNFAPEMGALATTIGGSLVPIFTTLGTTMGGIASAIMPAITAAMASLLPVIGQIINTVTRLAGAVLPVLISIFSQLAPFLIQIATMIGQIVAALAPMIAQLIGALLPVITNIITVVMNVITSVMPSLIAILNVIMSVIGALVPIIMDILSVVISVISGIISAVNPIISFIGMVISAIMAVITPIVAFVGNIIATIVSVIGTIIGIVTGIFSTVFSIISSVFSNISNFISTVIAAVSTVISSLTGVVGGVFNGIYAVVSSVMSSVGSFISGIFDGIKSAWNGLTSFVSGVFDGVASAVGQLVAQVKGFVNGVIGGINSAIGLINMIPGVSIGAIPYLLHGTDDWQGGFARMNEGGRGELTYLPNGTQVIPHDISVQYAKEAARNNAGSGTQTIDYDYLIDGIASAMSNVKVQHTSNLNGKALASEIVPLMDRGFGDSKTLKERYV